MMRGRFPALRPGPGTGSIAVADRGPVGGRPLHPDTERGLPMKVAVVRETAHGEQRVALVPEAVVKLRAAGYEILVESGAG